MERYPRTVREVTQIQHFIQKGERRQDNEKVCSMRRLRKKTLQGGVVCPKCKKPVVAMVKEDGIVMFDQSIKKAT